MKIAGYTGPFFMVYDTETNGKITNYIASPDKVEYFPRLSQLSYQIYNGQRNLIKQVNRFVFPDGWEFPDEEFFKLNADIEKNKREGLPVVDVLKEFIEDRVLFDYAICHNVSFDSKIIRSEMFRAGIERKFGQVKICTMANPWVTSFCALPKLGGGYGKWPKLEELHEKLFGTKFDGAHDSLADVNATARCLFALIDNGVISLEREIAMHAQKLSKYDL